MKKIYAIFVNYNSGKQLLQGVKVVLTSPSIRGIIVIDNNSQDNSLQMLEKVNSSKLIIVKNKRNVGFYKALNKAIKKAFALGADAVMPLDFDLDFSFDFISKLLKIDADIVAPILKSKMYGKWFYDYGGIFNWRTGESTHILKPKPQKGVGVITASRNENDPNRFDFVSGGCTIFRKEVFGKIGYFDEDYFVYFGDADFAVVAMENGLKVVLDGNTIVHHKIEVASDTRNFRKLKISFFDNLTFIRKRVKWYYRPVAYLNMVFIIARVLYKTFS